MSTETKAAPPLTEWEGARLREMARVGREAGAARVRIGDMEIELGPEAAPVAPPLDEEARAEGEAKAQLRAAERRADVMFAATGMRPRRAR